MSELKVDDRFYFPEQEDGFFREYWGKSGVITGEFVVATCQYWRIETDDGDVQTCYKWRLQKEETKGMTKDQLKTGILVQTRDDKWYVVQLNRVEGECDLLIDLNSGGFLKVDRYNNDLTHVSDKIYDIVKVAKCDYTGDIFRGIKDGTKVDNFTGFKIIWERTQVNPKEQQLNKLIDELQSQLENAKGELQKIKQVK